MYSFMIRWACLEALSGLPLNIRNLKSSLPGRMSSEIISNNPVVKAVIEGTAPRPARLAASRGILPLPQSDLLEILVSFFDGEDTELKENSLATLRSQQTDALESAIRSAEVAPSVLAYFAGQEQLPASVHEAIITNSKTPPAAIAEF